MACGRLQHNTRCIKRSYNGRLCSYHAESTKPITLQWRHSERDGVSNHQPHDCLFNTTVYSDADQRKHQSSASLAFVRGIHRWPVNSPHKGPVTRKMFPFDDVIMNLPIMESKFIWRYSHSVFNYTVFCTNSLWYDIIQKHSGTYYSFLGLSI